MAVVRIELAKDFRYGTGVSVEDLEAKGKSKDIPALCKDLEKFGKVTVVMHGESSSRVGDATEISSGRMNRSSKWRRSQGRARPDSPN